MKNELTDYEKVMYKFAYECALKGIDIEELLGTIWNVSKDIFETIVNLTNKNYEYLKRCRESSKDGDENE